MSRPRRERRIAHEWRAQRHHTHERVVRDRVVEVRCSKTNCRKDGKTR